MIANIQQHQHQQVHHQVLLYHQQKVHNLVIQAIAMNPQIDFTSFLNQFSLDNKINIRNSESKYTKLII